MQRTPHLLFVCTGNLHRSVMAAAMVEAMLRALGASAVVGSAGTLGLQGQPAPAAVQQVCQELGLDVSGHSNRPLTRSLVERSDRIIVMQDSHGDAVLRLSAQAEDRIIYLGDYLEPPGEVWDPIGQPLSRFRECRDLILGACQRLLPELLQSLPMVSGR
jgi:protein-tyrosine phosphatase